MVSIGWLKAQNNAEAIRAVMLQQETDWNNGDIRSFMNGYWQNDSLQFIGNKGITMGWQKTLNNYLKAYDTRDKMGQLHFSDLQIRVLSDVSAFVIGKWRLERTQPVEGYFTLLWRKVDGKWLIVCDHTH